jgi:hypothetical protein
MPAKLKLAMQACIFFLKRVCVNAFSEGGNFSLETTAALSRNLYAFNQREKENSDLSCSIQKSVAKPSSDAAASPPNRLRPMDTPV